jgi:hypothetical protein
MLRIPERGRPVGLAAGVLLLGLVGCTSSPGRPPATARDAGEVPATHASAPGSPAPATAVPPRPTVSAGTGVPTNGGPFGADQTANAMQRACGHELLLAAARRFADNPARGFVTERIDIAGCRNGYARIFVVPRKVSSPVEGDQLFLRLVGDSWQLVDRGASLDCGDENLKPPTTAACRALR